MGDNQEDSLRKAVRQFIDAQLQGQAPDIDEFVRQYPEFEDQIRQKVRNLQKIDTLFDSLVQADEDDFEGTATGQDLVGQTLGHFEIAEMIGRGGMGLVYLAHDTKLDRSVAIKSMPSGLTENATTRTRFQREAKLLASLSHPNIAVIHEIIEQVEGADYLVLEYVPGETLAQRITDKPLKLNEALSIGKEIAEALSAAHEKGIVHRDLKPGNIKITPEGRVKVLDFGLAKTISGKSSEKPTTVTQAGRVIGTPAYMSPEQARGKPTDKRSDIWSFGCIMYQMLTGQLPFEGQTATDTLARIIEREPDWKLLPENTPASIRMLLHRCLEKNADKRLDNIAEAAIEINDTMSKSGSKLVVTSKPAKSKKVAMIIGAAVVCVILFIIALKFIPQNQIQPSQKEIRLVVLPFENPGPVEAEWFADTMTDEITTRLVGIRSLAVIARQSAFAYKNKKIPARQIAKELSVDYVVTGTVQCEFPSDPNETASEVPPDPNTPVRIRVQLIKAADDKVEWADSYDGDMYEVLTFQSHMAEEVAQALDIVLLEPERRALASKLTQNSEAYVYYVRGREYLGEDTARAIQMFERAIELDPNYAQAYAALSLAHTGMYWLFQDRSEERLIEAEKAARIAVYLDPELPEARMALGRYYFHCRFDYDSAYEQFEIVRKNLPNAALILYWIAAAQSRQAKFEEALVNLKRAYELNPASTSLPDMIANNLRLLRRYEEEQRYMDKLISLAPDRPRLYVKKAESCLFSEGDIDEARATLEDARANTSETDEDFFRIHDLDVTLDIYSRDYHEALKKLLSKPRDFDDMVWFIPNDLRLAEVYRYLGNEQLAQHYYQSAVAILEEKVAEDPNDCRFHSALGKAYAGLGGHEQDAVDEGKLGVKYRPVEKDAHNGPLHLDDLARIYVMVGKYNEAIDILQRLLKMPSELTVPWLRVDPVWDPLRDHPRFQALLKSNK